MRKFFAAAMAAAMVMGMNATSFAATSQFDDTAFEKVYKYSDDKNVMQYNDNLIEYGKKAYIQLVENNKGITNYKQVEKLKIKAKFEMGEDLVDSISVVKKYIKPTAKLVKTTDASGNYNGADIVVDGAEDIMGSDGNTADVNNVIDVTYNDNGTVRHIKKLANLSARLSSEDLYNTAKLVSATVDFEGGYYYFVEFATVKERTTADNDVIGTLEFKRNKNNNVTPNVAEVKDEEHDFSFNLWYENNYVTDGKVDSSSFQMDWDDLYVLKFEYDDEVDFEFGSDTNEGTFTVDVSGQGKMVIDFNTDANDAIANANPGVKMYFVNFNGAKFNRTGTFEYEMEDMVAAYKVVDNKLVEIPGLELDGDTATFRTSTLGNYVFADAELVNPAAPVVDAPVVEAPVTNPTTGGPNA